MDSYDVKQPVSWDSSEIILICRFSAHLLSIITGARLLIRLLTMLFNQFENLFFQL